MPKSRRLARWGLGLLALAVIASGGALVAVQLTFKAATGSVTQQNLLGKAGKSWTITTGGKHAEVTGAKNILLVGIDRRAKARPGSAVRSDSIMLMHIAADHRSAYLISLPRDSYVAIPAYDNGRQRYAGGKNKINAAFAYGSRGLTGADQLSHGFELLSLTVRNLTGITPDAGAIIDFPGFRKVVDVLGKVCMYVDEDTTSVHTGKDSNGRPATPYVLNSDGTIRRKVRGVTATVYRKGDHCFTPAQALDFVRQRDLIGSNDSDYGRQRHQQQFLKAILRQAVDDGLSSPTKLPGLLKAIGGTMTVDTGGISMADWAFAMRRLNPDDLVTIRTNGGRFNSRRVPGAGSVEVLSADSLALLRAARDDTVDRFVATHPSWVAKN